MFILLLSYSSVRVRAQADFNPPDRMTYQGFLVNNLGDPLAPTTPKNYDVIFRIYDASSAGNRLWSEEQTVTVDKGNFSVLLGEGSSVGTETRPNLSTVFAGQTASDRYIAISVKFSGTTFSDIVPRLRLLPSPYSFLAKNAINLVKNDGSPLATVVSGNFQLVAPLNVTGEVTGNSFAGNGANMTDLKANNITTGTLDDARLTANIAKLDSAQTFTGAKTFTGTTTFDTANATTVNATTVNGFGTIPIGGIIMWSGSVAPSGWALCDGGQYGSVHAPDLRGRFVLGMGNGVGLTGRSLNQQGGEERHTLSIAEMPSHNHNWGHGVEQDDSGSGGSYNEYTQVGGNDGGVIGYTGGNQPHNTMPPFWVLAFIIRIQ